MKIDFNASLQGTNTIKLDDDNSGQIKLTFDASQYASIAHLSCYQRKLLRVTIETSAADVKKAKRGKKQLAVGFDR